MPTRIFVILALSGTAVLILAVTYAALGYRGRAGEKYSLLNHFISELGEVGVSRGAWAFNAGMVITGILLLPFVVHLGVVLGSVLGWIGASFAAVAALGAAAVGVFPMNNLKPHVRAAMTFFYAGLAMVLVLGAAVLVQPSRHAAVSRLASVLSLAPALAFGAFIVLLRVRPAGTDAARMLDPQLTPERPRVWALPLLEWLVFFTTILWLSGMAFFA